MANIFNSGIITPPNTGYVKTKKIYVGTFIDNYTIQNCIDYEKIIGESFAPPRCIKTENWNYSIGDVIYGSVNNNEFLIKTENGEWLNIPLSKLKISTKDVPLEQQFTSKKPNGKGIPIGSAPTQQEPVSDLQYYTSANFLKRASVSIVPVGLIGAYCYHKKFSLLKSALLVSIPIVAITALQYAVMGGGKNSYWGIFVPPSMKTNSIKQIK